MDIWECDREWKDGVEASDQAENSEVKRRRSKYWALPSIRGQGKRGGEVDYVQEARERGRRCLIAR